MAGLWLGEMGEGLGEPSLCQYYHYGVDADAVGELREVDLVLAMFSP